MKRIAVGEKFPGELHGGIGITLGEAGFTAIFKLKDLDKEEILNFHTGDLRIDISFLEKIIFFVFDNPKGIGSADIPFTVHLADVKELQEIKENEGYRMDLILVEGKNNIVKGLRMISFNNRTSKYIKKYIDAQLLETDFNKENYKEKIITLQKKYKFKDIKGMSRAYTSFKR
ncbi:hypothetical protein IC214_00140 [Clostridioides sp. ES-S-0190-01]|nr:hypothetical protein [Clostridioides sp. ES-S-0145-01]MCC0682289.1 hypothetical protein [Clostridioides sp. ES-S-0005-03]MCC0705446.1 hypothetical protein [Clostridioides sp. ES-S-0190-01]UDN64189.1 hypothetical protein IC758_20330 [Clostridioides sp. ES-W-0016-02]